MRSDTICLLKVRLFSFLSPLFWQTRRSSGCFQDILSCGFIVIFFLWALLQPSPPAGQVHQSGAAVFQRPQLQGNFVQNVGDPPPFHIEGNGFLKSRFSSAETLLSITVWLGTYSICSSLFTLFCLFICADKKQGSVALIQRGKNLHGI